MLVLDEEIVDEETDGAVLDSDKLGERLPDAECTVFEDTFVVGEGTLWLEDLQVDGTLELTDFFVVVGKILEELLVKVAEDIDELVLLTNVSGLVIAVAVHLTVEQYVKT